MSWLDHNLDRYHTDDMIGKGEGNVLLFQSYGSDIYQKPMCPHCVISSVAVLNMGE